MSETVNQVEEVVEERTFSQAEVDAIVGDRLKRERMKYADYDSLKEKATKLDEIEEANKSELQKATERAEALQMELNKITKANEIRDMRQKVSEETGVPVSLITAENEEEARKQAEDIVAYARQTGYPSVKDAGEARPGKPSVQQQFGEWAAANLW